MQDPYWLDVHRAIVPFLNRTDCVLAPHGDWPPFPCSMRTYNGPFELGDATVVLVHKGRLTALRKDVLARIMRDWTCLHANLVFVALSATAPRSFRPATLLHSLYLRRVHNYLRSRQLKQRPETLYFVHIPKTGGTSMWDVLKRAFPSCVYYADLEYWQANPPAPGEYDLVGLHFPPSVLTPVLRDGDFIIGLFREPTERFLSGIVHARRLEEDPVTFTPAMRTMRDVPVADFLGTEDGRREVRLQLVTLGADHRRPHFTYSDAALWANARDCLDQENILFIPSNESEMLLDRLVTRFAVRPRRLRRLNANPPARYAAFADEFHAARPLIERENAVERDLYQEVRNRFVSPAARTVYGWVPYRMGLAPRT